MKRQNLHATPKKNMVYENDQSEILISNAP